MPFFRCLVPTFLLLLFSLLSCSSDSKYPYTIVKGDPYNTRLYTLPQGVKLYIARTAEQARVSAALCMPSVASDTLGTLYTQSVCSEEYPMLFARIGSEVSRVGIANGSTVVYNNIPSNELENWAVIMQGSFLSFPDSLSIVLVGDVAYDDAVTTMARHFEKATYMHSAAAACADDAAALPAAVRTLLFENIEDGECKKIVSLSDARADAKNNIKLLPSPPAKVIFPDIDKLKIISTREHPRMVVAENDDTHFTFIVRTRMNEIPASSLALIEEYFETSLNAENDSIPIATNVKADKGSRTLEFSVSGRAETALQTVIQAVINWQSVADSEKFYKYLLANSDVVDASKRSNENIAMQAADYIARRSRLCGMREMAEYSMDVLFSSSSELYFCGKNADEIYPLLLKQLHPMTAPVLSDTSAPGDTLAGYLLLPADTNEASMVTIGEPYSSVEDLAAIALFNKAASLSSIGPATKFYPNGALLFSDDSRPLTREAFEAAKSFLLYDCSTHGGNGLSLIKEYYTLNEQGYTSSQLYDALMRLSLFDVENFYKRHKDNSDTQLIVGRESGLNLRELKKKGSVVHLTYSELFGY